MSKILELKGITKRFEGVTALENVDFEIGENEIHGLLGENGAGKSTLMKILHGVLGPDEGEIIVNGNPVVFHNPEEANKHGVNMVYQELHLIPHLTVAENIYISQLPRNKYKKINWDKLYGMAAEQTRKLGVNINVKQRVGELSVAHQQLVAILRAIIFDCKILILDEPTSALPKKDVENLFKVMKQLKKQGIAIVFITHKLDEVMQITDRITVLRDGKKISILDTEKATEEKLAELIAGRYIENKFPKVKYEVEDQEILRLVNVCVKDKLENISFTLKKGEILGIAGLLGAGKTEIAKTIFGVYDTADISGDIYLKGEKIFITSPVQAVRQGIGYVPENRADEGLLTEHDVGFNISLPALRKVSVKFHIKKSKEHQLVGSLIKSLSVKCSSVRQKVKNLSGGNQQKVVLAKWLAVNANLIIFDEPTRGIDVGAKTAVYEFMNRLVKEGIGVLLLSSEVPEIYGMADQIIVIRGGKIKHTGKPEDFSEQELQRLVMT